VAVRGEGDAISALLQFSVPNRWLLIDVSDGEYIDADHPSQQGWESFQPFRDKTLEEE
jgi:hypothetical protein